MSKADSWMGVGEVKPADTKREHNTGPVEQDPHMTPGRADSCEVGAPPCPSDPDTGAACEAGAPRCPSDAVSGAARASASGCAPSPASPVAWHDASMDSAA
eukprot:scaffold187038_cov29-Tisochrysis_lutea.AAC.4